LFIFAQPSFAAEGCPCDSSTSFAEVADYHGPRAKLRMSGEIMSIEGTSQPKRHIRKAMNKFADQAEKYLSRCTLSDEINQGFIDYQFTIQPDGKVRDIVNLRTDLSDLPFLLAVEREMAALRFPPPEAPRESLLVHWRLTFIGGAGLAREARANARPWIIAGIATTSGAAITLFLLGRVTASADWGGDWLTGM
jgi:hypothetical protein